VPSLITVHDLAIYRNPDWFPSRQPLSTRWIVPSSIRRAQAIIAISQNTAQDLRQLFDVPPDKISVAYSGVNENFRPLPPDELAGVRKELALPERFVLFVGTIEPRKNVETLVRALGALEPPVPLVIAGAYGWRYESTRRLIDASGERVRVLGPVRPELLPALYNLAACLAHPAWYEGFGLTPLEAMACGTPVVCSTRSSLPEVVGDAALLVDPGDVEGWNTAVRIVLSDPQLAADLRLRGQQRAREFSWQRTARQTWQVADQLLSA
jgi:glycosyltransferase involved in cell wall biosynthesis